MLWCTNPKLMCRIFLDLFTFHLEISLRAMPFVIIFDYTAEWSSDDSTSACAWVCVDVGARVCVCVCNMNQ